MNLWYLDTLTVVGKRGKCDGELQDPSSLTGLLAPLNILLVSLGSHLEHTMSGEQD
jgi:hypothetical protein